MDSITKLCGLEKDKSIVLNLARTLLIEGATCISLALGETLEINDFQTYPVYVITAGKLSSAVQVFEFGTFINQQIYEKPLVVQENSVVHKLNSVLTQRYLHELAAYYQEFNCILESIFRIEVNLFDRNCIQLISCNENTLLTNDGKLGKYFYVMLEGSCNVRKTFRFQKQEDVSLDLYAFKNYYLLGEEALFSEPYSKKVMCTGFCYFLKINVEKFSRCLPISGYLQLQLNYKSKTQKIDSTTIKKKSEHKSKGMNPQDIIQYYERANQMNTRKANSRDNRTNYHNINILQKFCEKNQTTTNDYMNYFVESTQQKIRFQLISKGYKKPEVSEKTSTSLSQEQMKFMLRQRVVNELKTRGKSRKLFDTLMSSRSKLKTHNKKIV